MIFRTDKPSFFRGFNEESESRLFLKRLETFWIRAARASDWHLVITTPFFFLWKTQSFPYSTTSVIRLADTTNYNRLLDSCYLTLFSSLFEKSCKKSRARGTSKETALPTDQVTSMSLLRAFFQTRFACHSAQHRQISRGTSFAIVKEGLGIVVSYILVLKEKLVPRQWDDRGRGWMKHKIWFVSSWGCKVYSLLIQPGFTFRLRR